MKSKLLATLFIGIMISFACEKDKKNNSTLTVGAFSVVAKRDTVPCEINVIYTTTSLGLNNYLFIHEGAFLDPEYTNQKDSTQSTSMSTEELSRTDTLKLYYNKAGNYQVSMEAKDNVYKENITLYSKE